MSQQKVVSFIKPWSHYYPGDNAGFDQSTADELIKKGIAKPIVNKTIEKKDSKTEISKE